MGLATLVMLLFSAFHGFHNYHGSSTAHLNPSFGTGGPVERGHAIPRTTDPGTR